MADVSRIRKFNDAADYTKNFIVQSEIDKYLPGGRHFIDEARIDACIKNIADAPVDAARVREIIAKSESTCETLLPEENIVTSQNALKNYPYTKMREDFALLIMKSKFELAEQSVESRKLERFRDAEDECYGFLNEYPDSKNKSLAEQFINKCKKITKN